MRIIFTHGYLAHWGVRNFCYSSAMHNVILSIDETLESDIHQKLLLLHADILLLNTLRTALCLSEQMSMHLALFLYN